jgi:hypothetical protein
VSAPHPQDPPTGTPTPPLSDPAPPVGSPPVAGAPAGPQDGGGRAQETGQEAAAQSQQLAESARGQAQQVGATAKREAARVADEVGDHALDLVDSATTALRQQADAQTHQVAGTLSSIAGQVRALSEGRKDEAGDVDAYARQAADAIGSFAERIDSLGASGVVDEVTRFARRRPGAFLAGAAAAGVVVSRFLRNASGSSGQVGASGRTSQSGQPGPAAGALPPSTSAGPGPGISGDVPPTERPATPLTPPPGAVTGSQPPPPVAPPGPGSERVTG